MTTDTIYALSSGRPPAGISIIRLSGPSAHQAGAQLAGPLPAERLASVRPFREPSTGELLDEGIILRFNGPSSATGEDVVEFHCHGGRAVGDAILLALSNLEGVRLAEPGEFTRRAFLNGRIDLTEAEGIADLIEAETQSQREAALGLSTGGFHRQIDEWRAQVLAIAASAERAIDYDDEDGGVDALVTRGCAALADELQEWLDRPRVEPLKDGVRVIVAGPPNSGKSSLINVIAGEEKAIVTDLPGTTRDSIEVPLALGGVPIRLTDTAGLRVTNDLVEAHGVDRARQLIAAADVLVWLGSEAEMPNHPRAILVHPKADLVPAQPIGPCALPVSSRTRVGLADLLHRIEDFARNFLSGGGGILLNRRQAAHIASARSALLAASHASEAVILAEHLREARVAFDCLTGRAGVDDLLDTLFGRFCLGK